MNLFLTNFRKKSKLSAHWKGYTYSCVCSFYIFGDTVWLQWQNRWYRNSLSTILYWTSKLRKCPGEHPGFIRPQNCKFFGRILVSRWRRRLCRRLCRRRRPNAFSFRTLTLVKVNRNLWNFNTRFMTTKWKLGLILGVLVPTF